MGFVHICIIIESTQKFTNKLEKNYNQTLQIITDFLLFFNFEVRTENEIRISNNANVVTLFVWFNLFYTTNMK